MIFLLGLTDLGHNSEIINLRIYLEVVELRRVLADARL